MSHFVATENVFETIGNYPVLDQFDVGYTNMLSGSTTDHYITGSVFNRLTDGQGNVVLITFGTRGRAFSKLGTSIGKLPLESGTSYQLQPWRERAGSVKFLKILSNLERYYDSVPPDISQIVPLLGGKIAELAVGPPAIILGDYSAGNTAQGFIESFPFEPKYSNINRAVNSFYIVTHDESGNPLPANKNVNGVVIQFLFSNLIISFTDSSTSFKILNKKDISKNLFGYGDFDFWKTDSLGNSLSYSHHVPVPRLIASTFSSPPFLFIYVVSPIIRGWKYGLIDGNPHYTSCVYRRDKYGQLRDMLEQRQQTTFLIDEKNSPLVVGSAEEPLPLNPGTPEGTFQYTTQPAVVVTHKERILDANGQLQWVTKLATLSSSSNISQYCTSSLPYFDGLSRNR